MAESISNLTGLLPQLVTVQAVQYDAALTIALPGVVPNISVSSCAVWLCLPVQMTGICQPNCCAGCCDVCSRQTPRPNAHCPARTFCVRTVQATS